MLAEPFQQVAADTGQQVIALERGLGGDLVDQRQAGLGAVRPAERAPGPTEMITFTTETPATRGLQAW